MMIIKYNNVVMRNKLSAYVCSLLAEKKNNNSAWSSARNELPCIFESTARSSRAFMKINGRLFGLALCYVLQPTNRRTCKYRFGVKRRHAAELARLIKPFNQRHHCNRICASSSQLFRREGERNAELLRLIAPMLGPAHYVRADV